MKHDHEQFEIRVESPMVQELRRARARVQKGWCKNTLEDEDGNVCAIGALSLGRNCGTMYVSQALIELHSYATIEGYNDAPETTQADILALFDRAIELAKQEEV
jgi:hypothetical protein